MITSSPFYVSGTFWAIALFIVSIATLALMFALWRADNPRCEIAYSVAVLQWVTGRESLAEPYVVELVVESRSRRDIRSADFDQGKPLVFMVAAPVVELTGTRNRVRDGNIQARDGEVLIGPCLIRRGVVTRLRFVTDGRPDVSCQSPLIDIPVRVVKDKRDMFSYEYTTLPKACEIMTVAVSAITCALTFGCIIGNGW